MKRLFSFFIILTALSACTKQTVDTPEFSVVTEKIVYKTGDKVKFIFSGNPDLITFYSGEAGKKYEFRERVTANGTPQLQFTSFRQYGPQDSTLSLLVSLDFNGIYNAENLALATWKDITASAVLSTGADNTPSGPIDLSEFMQEEKSVYIAFRYRAKKLPVSQPTWTIKNLTVNNVQADGSPISVATIANLSWGNIGVSVPSRAWTFSTTQLQSVGVAANAGADNEAWIVSRPLSLNTVQRDVGLAIKNMTARKPFYEHVYTEPGTYTATFEVWNTNVYDSKTEYKEVSVKVE